jgi:hypothetical protein
MAKIVTMHQPNYLPWIGLFSKVAQSDCFILNDCVQYTADSVANRNRIRTNAGWCYLTIPISRSKYTSKILDVTLPENRSWMDIHWKTIYQNYVKTRFLMEHKEFFEKLYQKDFKYLWQVNENIVLYLLDHFNIRVEILRASQLGIDPNLHKTDLIIACLKSAGADIYLSGPSGRNYLEFDKFPQNKIDLKFFKFQHPVYRQRYPGFEPNLSAIDLLFNMGPKASEIIKMSGIIEG